MSYKISKIILFRDYESYYFHHIFNFIKEFDLPYVAGDFQGIISNDMIDTGTIKEIKQPLFNNVRLCRIAESAEPNTILFIELQKNNWLDLIILDFNQVVVDIFYAEGNRLLYSFFNVTNRAPLSLTLRKQNDQGNTYEKLKANAADPYYRHYLIKRALHEVNDEELRRDITSELMTAAEVAKYLQLQKKTIQNWTSAGKIPVEYANGSPRYRKKSIDLWLQNKNK